MRRYLYMALLARRLADKPPSAVREIALRDKSGVDSVPGFNLGARRASGREATSCGSFTQTHRQIGGPR